MCDHGSYVQAGPDGGPLFVHRFFNKFAPPGAFPDPPKWQPEHLPMEATAWRYFLEWLTAPARNRSVAAEVPGWFSPSECEFWQQTCAGRTVLELGRHLGRSTCAAAFSASRVVAHVGEVHRRAGFVLALGHGCSSEMPSGEIIPGRAESAAW